MGDSYVLYVIIPEGENWNTHYECYNYMCGRKSKNRRIWDTVGTARIYGSFSFVLVPNLCEMKTELQLVTFYGLPKRP